ncbi:hypothetical protein WOLCODRAFT_138640 [Wolfiporia cocos MD-104 SS10]|uniref:Uncharacterized protein n=1 Tax=Wolfiporia cocos (strain MD-104) TaxID=742152 RepID=A0A2H3JY87_WOLCO|nr:hypothetical protein WOLCODRAFT_138640 [Wolfiporia cocos MD-104 SS10]
MTNSVKSSVTGGTLAAGPIKKHMLRSATPAPNEKVMLYLQSLQEEPPENDDKTSSAGSHSRRSTSRMRARSTNGAIRLEGLAEEDVEEDVEDIRSDVQEGNGSDITRTVPIRIEIDEVPEREPGPDDPPGPKFESFGSSFGNFGPLPVDPVEMGVQNLSTMSHPNPYEQFGMTPLQGANVPLPASVASPNIPSSPVARSGNLSRTSNRPPSNGVVSPKSPSRGLSPNRMANVSDERLWSPRTGASQNPSAKSRTTQKTNHTAYPPLPESTAEDIQSRSHLQGEPLLEYPRAKTKSIAPSESISQVPSKHSTVKPPDNPPKIHTDPNGEGGSHRDAIMSPRAQASQVPMTSHGGVHDDIQRAAATMSPTRSKRSIVDPQKTPTPSRPMSPMYSMDELDSEEQRMVRHILSRPLGARTSLAMSTMAPSTLEPEIQNSHFHDLELCQLLHALDQPLGEPVKKAVRKAVRARVKKLGMKYDNESIKQYRRSFHDHDPSVHLAAFMSTVGSSRRSTQAKLPEEPPEWAKDLITGMISMRDRLDSLAPVLERTLQTPQGGPYDGHGYPLHQYGGSAYTRSPMTPSANVPPTMTMGNESMYQPVNTEVRDSGTHLQTLPGSMHRHDGSVHDAIRDEDDDLYGPRAPTDGGDTRGVASSEFIPPDSPGQQYLEEELYKLRVKPNAAQSVVTHKTWEIAQDNGEGEFEDDGDAQAAVTESGMPEIPDGNTGGYNDPRDSHSLPPLPAGSRDLVNMPEPQPWHSGEFGEEAAPPPWQRIHQRLLSWAIIWTMPAFDAALNSTMRGMQIDEMALSIWSTQTYKRYVRGKMTDSPPGRVDRLFVPPNMAEAISTAVYNGRHGDACGLLRELWAPFGLEGIPRLLIVLAKHRSDANHWVVHRFSLPDGSLTTYDTYPEKCLPDGRPLGWWFAIRIAWPDAIYPSPDHLMQKMVRLHRPMQLAIDNSVAAAGIWRNLIMGSRAERSLDLERLRDLINTEVQNLRQRKQLGKLHISPPKPNWEDMH